MLEMPTWYFCLALPPGDHFDMFMMRANHGGDKQCWIGLDSVDMP